MSPYALTSDVMSWHTPKLYDLYALQLQLPSIWVNG